LQKIFARQDFKNDLHLIRNNCLELPIEGIIDKVFIYKSLFTITV